MKNTTNARPAGALTGGIDHINEQTQRALSTGPSHHWTYGFATRDEMESFVKELLRDRGGVWSSVVYHLACEAQTLLRTRDFHRARQTLNVLRWVSAQMP